MERSYESEIGESGSPHFFKRRTILCCHDWTNGEDVGGDPCTFKVIQPDYVFVQLSYMYSTYTRWKMVRKWKRNKGKRAACHSRADIG